VAIALGLAVSNATAQTAGTDTSEGTFKGVVVSATATTITAKGEFASSEGRSSASSRGKSDARNVHFVAKGAKVTRGGWQPCELKDIEKGAAVTIAYTAAGQRRVKYTATRVDVAGEESAASQPILAQRGKLLFEDDFARAEMPPKWRLGKGAWSINDGVVVAAEKPEDNHGAYAYVEPRFPYKDIVAEFSVKFEGATGCHLMMEDNTYKLAHAGHIIRATITPTTANVADSKFGSMKNEIFEKMKDPQTTPSEKKQIQASIKDKSATFRIALDLGKWYQARVEVVGDEMLVSVDNQPVAYIKSEGVDHPIKNMIGFTVGGQTAQLDNLKVWEATPRSTWSESRAAVIESLRKL
jgi:hypothetical protein